jgi:hypothetical protein
MADSTTATTFFTTTAEMAWKREFKVPEMSS